MLLDFQYLKKYIPGGSDVNDNWFVPLRKDEIIECEQKLKKKFPLQLRHFYDNIGYGVLRCSSSKNQESKFYGKNEILPPEICVDYTLGIIEHPEEESYYMSAETYARLSPGDLPFFEICDGSSFMVMKLNSDNPNAVWYQGVEKIEDSFETFIYNLYHKGPTYYVDCW